jgi:hypothetical protein
MLKAIKSSRRGFRKFLKTTSKKPNVPPEPPEPRMLTITWTYPRGAKKSEPPARAVMIVIVDFEFQHRAHTGEAVEHCGDES